MYNDANKCGSRGGDGGRGGLGGHSGIVRIYDLSSSRSSIVLTNQTGTAGANGKAGAKGGNKAASESCPAIETSVDGGNVAGQKSPAPATEFDETAGLILFKAFARQRMANNLRRHELTRFIELIHRDERILGSYATLAFVRELEALERQYYEIEDRDILTTHYRSLMDRIESHVNGMNGTVIEPQTRKVRITYNAFMFLRLMAPRLSLFHAQVFNYVYTATLGKYLVLNATDEPNLIVDIVAYLNGALDSIEDIQSVRRQTIIENYRNSFSHGIDSKINDATAFIDGDILPGIQKITDTLDEDLYSLLNEVSTMINVTLEDQKALIEKQVKHPLNSTVCSFETLTVFLLGTFSTLYAEKASVDHDYTWNIPRITGGRRYCRRFRGSNWYCHWHHHSVGVPIGSGIYRKQRSGNKLANKEAT